MSVRDVAEVMGGEVTGDGPDAAQVTGPAVVDSRLVEPGGLFVAFVGEYADGHDFADAAVAAGAVAIVGTRPTAHLTIVVDDPQAALQRLASHVLAAVRAAGDLTVIAVTGSQGKTTTKDLLAAVLVEQAPTVATAGSFNNELGLPLTVLRATLETRFLVLEMGARGIGHIAELCRIAPPDVSLVLNVGKAHIGEFGTQADIAVAKGELVEALGPDGVAVLNADDPLVSAMASRTTARVVTFGEGAAGVRPDVHLADVVLDDLSRASFEVHEGGKAASVRLAVVGEHQAHNAAAVVAVARAVGVPLEAAAQSLASVRSLSKWRMEVTERSDGVTIINDSYNANPDSMRAALKSLAAIGRARGETCRTVAVLGEMRELGESSREEHDALGRLAVRLDIHRLLVVGEAAKAMHLGAHLEGSWGEESVFVPDNDAAIEWLRTHLRAGDVVVVKASRGARLDLVADAITADPAAGGAA